MGELMRRGNDIAGNVQATIEHADGLIQGVSPKIEQMASNSVGMTGNANAIVAGIRRDHGAAGKLLADNGVASNVDATIANAKQASTNLSQASGKVNGIVSAVQRTDLPDLHKTLNNTQDMTRQVDQAIGTFLAPGSSNQNTAVALRDAAHGAQQATSNLADDTEAVKHNFFLRGFFKRRGFYDLQNMTPERYATSEFVTKPRTRLWIPQRDSLIPIRTVRKRYPTLADRCWISLCQIWCLICQTIPLLSRDTRRTICEIANI